MLKLRFIHCSLISLTKLGGYHTLLSFSLKSPQQPLKNFRRIEELIIKQDSLIILFKKGVKLKDAKAAMTIDINEKTLHTRYLMKEEALLRQQD